MTAFRNLLGQMFLVLPESWYICEQCLLLCIIQIQVGITLLFMNYGLLRNRHYK
jgi:hypothetical protein